MEFQPAFPERSVQSVTTARGQLNGLAFAVKRDGLADVIDHNLARVAAGQVLLELAADARVHIAINVFVEGLEEIVAVHGLDR